MKMIFHFKDLTAKPDPRTYTFFVQLDRIREIDNPVITQLGEIQAIMMSVRLRRPVVCYKVAFPDMPLVGTEQLFVAREVKTWQDLVHAWS